MADRGCPVDNIVAVQFTDESGKLITTSPVGLTLIRDGKRNIAFYGAKGKSLLSDIEFEDLHSKLDLNVPAAPVVVVDDDDDFTIP